MFVRNNTCKITFRGKHHALNFTLVGAHQYSSDKGQLFDEKQNLYLRTLQTALQQNAKGTIATAVGYFEA